MKESHFISAGLCTLTYFWTKNVHFREEIFKEIFMIFLLRYRLKRWTQRFFNILTRIFLTTKKSSTSILLEFFLHSFVKKNCIYFCFQENPLCFAWKKACCILRFRKKIQKKTISCSFSLVMQLGIQIWGCCSAWKSTHK